MSTKTSIKRIALVAVAALGFGMVSTVSAHADAAQYTMTLGTITPVQGSTVVGSTITIPVLVDTAAASDAADVITFTATFTEKPINTSLAASSLTAGVTTRDAALATAGAALHSVAASSNTLVFTSGATAADLGGATAAGEFTFTPDTAGRYEIAIAASGNDAAQDVTAVDQISIVVGGAALTQAASGKKSTTGTAVAGGSAVLVYWSPGGTAASTVYNVTTSGVGSILNPKTCASLDETLSNSDTEVRCAAGASFTATTINGTNYLDGAKFTADATADLSHVDNGGTPASGAFTVDAASSVVGVQTVSVTSVNQATGVPTLVATVTINWTATASSAASAQYSTAWITTGATAATSTTDLTADGVSCSKAVSATACANVVVTVKDANSVALLNAPLSASITGPGVLGAVDEDGDNSASAKSGRAVSSSATTTHLDVNVGSFSIYSDGTAGTATITISSGTVVLSTKTVVFYGTVAKLTPTQNLSIARAGALGYELGCGTAGCTWLTVATTPAVYIAATDADGNIVPGLTITAVPADSAVISSATITQDDATAGDGPGYYNASVTSAPNGASGAKTTVVFRTLLATGAYVTSDPVTFTLGGGLETMTLSLDKSSYDAGEAMVVTREAKDSKGNPVYDGVTSPAVTFSKSVGGTIPAAGQFVAGKSATSTSRPSVFAPSVDGDFEARATYTVGSTLAAVQLIAKASVASNNGTTAAIDAANEATEAANAATDAANAAAEAADAATAAAQDAQAAVADLAAQVATLMAGIKAQITRLTNLIVKIQKKVNA
jgi:hypothetical protein